MPNSVSNRVFGSDIRTDIKQKLAFRQEFNKSADFGEAVEFVRNNYPADNNDGIGQYISNFTQFGDKTEVLADLSSRTPFVRMWTAVELEGYTELKKSQDYENEVPPREKWEKNTIYVKKDGEVMFQQLTTTEIQTYEIGNHVYNTFKTEGDILNTRTGDSSEVSKHIIPNVGETDNNNFMKPPAGITSLTSYTEGSMGLTKRTTIHFTVHNFHDFDTIYNRYFLRPGAQIFIDFGWDTANLYNIRDLINKKTTSSVTGKINSKNKTEQVSINGILYGDGGYVTDSFGDMDTLTGFVTNYDAKIQDDGTVKCNVEIVSQNHVLLNSNFNENSIIKKRLLASLEGEIVKFAAAQFDSENNIIAKSIANVDWTTDFKTIEDWEEIFRKFSGNFLGTSEIHRGFPGKNAMDTGVYWSSGENNKTLYITWGVFEDIILNNEFSFSEDDNTKLFDGDSIIFDSKDSFIRKSKALVNAQTNVGPEFQNTVKFRYPKNLSDTRYSARLNKEPSDISIIGAELTDGDNLIPLRDLFINLDIIEDAINKSSTLLEVLNYVIDKLNSSSSDLFDLSIGTTDYSSKNCSVIDRNLPIYDVLNKNDDDFFDTLFEFKPTSPNSIVKSYDISFTMPKDDLGNMVAIKAMSGTGNGIIPVSKDIDRNLALNGIHELASENYYTKSIPKIGSHVKKRINHRDSEKKTRLLLHYSKHVKDFEGQDKDTKFILDSLGGGNKNEQTLDEIGEMIENVGQDTWRKETLKEKNKKFKRMNEDALDEKEKTKYLSSVETSLDNYYTSTAVGKAYTDNNSTILPVTLTLSIYGISLLTPGDIFKIDYLPSIYKENVYFQITKVTHNISTSTWSTSLETVMRIRSSKKEKVSNYKDKAQIDNVVLSRRFLNTILGVRVGEWKRNQKNLERLKRHIRGLKPVDSLMKSTLGIDSDWFKQSQNIVYTFKGDPETFGGDNKPIKGSVDVINRIGIKTPGTYYDAESGLDRSKHEYYDIWPANIYKEDGTTSVLHGYYPGSISLPGSHWIDKHANFKHSFTFDAAIKNDWYKYARYEWECTITQDQNYILLHVGTEWVILPSGGWKMHSEYRNSMVKWIVNIMTIKALEYDMD